MVEELRFAIWRPSLTYMLQQDGSRRDVLSPYRVSKTAQQKWFSDELQAIMAGIDRRFEEMFGLEGANLEYWQGTDYPAAGSFYYHLDSGYWENHYAGDRILTLLCCISPPPWRAAAPIFGQSIEWSRQKQAGCWSGTIFFRMGSAITG